MTKYEIKILHISVCCDKMGKGRRNNLSICCSTMPVNTYVLGKQFGIMCILRV